MTYAACHDPAAGSPPVTCWPVSLAYCNRRPFTSKELKALLQASNEEWQTMILTAFYTGLRLRDCANLTWQNIELHTGTINVLTEKTKRRKVLPIAEPLSRHLQKLAGDNPNAALCPALHGKDAS
jgi:integrase